MATGWVIAVITGDIVDSSGSEWIEKRPVSVVIARAGRDVKDHFQSAIHAQIDVFRGDSWQMVVREPAIAVRVGLYFRALLRANYSIDSRVSIGFGEVEFLPLDDISTGTGPAFTLSGKGLEECRKPARMNISFPFQTETFDGQAVKIITRLIDLQAGRWTPGQSRAVAGALLGLTQVEIAASWQPEPISQQGISQHLENAGWTQINAALRYLEEALPSILA